MLRFAANLSFLYPECGFLDRYAAAAADGFEGVECLFPYDYDQRELIARLQANGLQQVLINAPAGDWAAGERGLASLAGREAEFRHSIHVAIEHALALSCPRIHVMAGLQSSREDRASALARYRDQLGWAAEQAGRVGLQLLIEAINETDMPGYLLNRQRQAHDIVQAVGSAHLRVQMDLYHCQRSEGRALAALEESLPTGRVAHLQLAGVPDRHEPDHGEMPASVLLPALEGLARRCDWQGWIGCEYRPRLGPCQGATTEGLGWLRHWRSRPRGPMTGRQPLPQATQRVSPSP